MTKIISAFSGGKDSTCMVLRAAELGMTGELFFTPTGDELPELIAHIADITARTGWKLIVKSCGHSLYGLIKRWMALPNHRQRWCTRELKIEPAKAYLLENPGSTLLIGLRADEMEREGLFGEYANYRYPLREWGRRIQDVRKYLADKGVTVPKRTDCALCYGQRIGEWFALWQNHPEIYAKGEALEAETGHTFRSPSRDTWSTSLADLRKEFESGRRPRRSLKLSGEDDTNLDRCTFCNL